MLSEFDLIKRFFTRNLSHTTLGVGDDAALIEVPVGEQIAISTDMLVAEHHFFSDVDPYKLGYKALAVNLSDMAAMGAVPRWATLSLALPNVEEAWLKNFSQGFFDLADKYKVDLIGGDTNKGPLNICVEIMGLVITGKALKRDGAKAGDQIWISGQLGNAALGLAHLQKRITLVGDDIKITLDALYMPQPRVDLGLKLRGIAHSAIDISDGLLGDLSHILERSGVGGEIYFDKIPRSSILEKYIDDDFGKKCLLSGGDDYELCFTAPKEKKSDILKISETIGISLTCVGEITKTKILTVVDASGSQMNLTQTGFDHFKS